MIKRKFRQSNGEDYKQGKLIKMVKPSTSNNSLIIKKDEKQNFARVIRIQSEKKLGPNQSFISESRAKMIRDVYTPSQKDKLNQSIRKLNSSQSHKSLSTNKPIGIRKQSAKEQVRMIQNNILPQEKEQINQLKSLSKLVDYNLYKNQSSNANRQIIFDQNRSQMHHHQSGKLSLHTTTTNQSILKIQQLQNTQRSKASHQNSYHLKQRSFNQPLQSDRSQLVEINGNSAHIHSKSLALNIQSTRAQQNNKNLPLLTSKSNSLASPPSQIKTFRYGQESVQIKENKVIRQKDQPRYNYGKKTVERNPYQSLPSNLQGQRIINQNKKQ